MIPQACREGVWLGEPSHRLQKQQFVLLQGHGLTGQSSIGDAIAPNKITALFIGLQG